ncbi:hypothetical protein EZS27_010652 [termite gut metagenome]|uniref:Surface glycan-binding protein B xyloglucan binding domain-containing protein n=1 Tax=termite gut metagenome TaxID=433724 RepID=A0A5J4S805_9ZZZZ
MKKMSIYKRIAQSFLIGVAVCLGYTACEEYPDAFEATNGAPEVVYVRITDVASADSLLDGAFLGNTICLVGNNLRSVHEIYFNDQKAILNTGFITDHTLIVVVPKGIPEKVTNKIYLITAKQDTIVYPPAFSGEFITKVPAPVLNSISCEYIADGEEGILHGDYFIDDPDEPLEVVMSGNIPVTDIISIEKTQIRFRVPEGAQKGFINVTTLYGTGRSHFQFRDDRGIILNWDNLNAAGGWRAGNLAEANGISGKYVVFKGDLDNGDWNEDGFSFNLWGNANGRPKEDLLDASNLSSLQLKFEINIQGAWSCDAMQFVFTPWSTSGTNSYYSDNTLGRALWIPWATTGSYETNGWITVSIPMSNFKYTGSGAASSAPEAGGYGGLSIFVWNGGVEGKACSPTMWLDNIRVVPIE